MAQDVLIEIGLEELPARFIDDAEAQMLDKTIKWLDDQRISYSSAVSFSTPRRLAVLIKEAADNQTSIEEEAKGPALKIAKDDQGNWTKAAEGFTRGQGKTTDDIYIKEVKGTSYIYVKKYIEGKTVQSLLPEFKDIIESITFGKNMRWSNETLRYARPIRWLVALYGNEVIPFEIAHVKTSNFTYGHRFLSGKLTIEEPKQYEQLLSDHYVIANAKKREAIIVEQLEALQEKNGFHIPVEKELLSEVKNLVEYPTAFVGSFAPSFLELPNEVLITSMAEHQRYFPVKRDGELLPQFVGVRNGDAYELETVIRGNEKVLRARLADAEFFFEEDKKLSIDFFQEKLTRVVFQEKLGTYAEKVNRVKKIAHHLAKELQLTEIKEIVRAAEISKFDLMTNMVNEFTELQGVMGEKYATFFGETKEVSQAIREHYLPKQSHGELPATTVGAVLSIADKLDTIAGCISVGLIPSGSQDPYGLRRQAMGILRILKDQHWDLTVESLIEYTLTVLQDSGLVVNASAKDELQAFFASRAEYLMREEDIETDIIHAVVDNQLGIFHFAVDKAHVLSVKKADAQFKSSQEALVRVLNLEDKVEDKNHEISSSLFQTESEKALYNAVESVKSSYIEYLEAQNSKAALNLLANLGDDIHAFFDHNMIMDDNEEVRKNRLSMIHELSVLILKYADLRKIAWKQHA
ncbi:glycine--tRNA ligase subunit beta [Oceanobacillus jeddahense]|uniref:Glycine--tRNA ligase beta subunit n=1 Tax=Oceanobacillus jeddahense TaxID=1462527 RepID=A0ABY5JQM2_9BACI|nr:glycine--tRNA ligase subunit beta [Oceanobacillus jeddahense]UUI01361.1 glycine--tRNA ligase subunit beta [Oceanobacillus jeddahense]